MENTLVSARVTKAKKDRAAALLATNGSTMSDLINDAIDQLIDGSSQSATGKRGAKRSKADFQKFVARSTLNVQWPSNTPDYKNLERDWRLHDYESLS